MKATAKHALRGVTTLETAYSMGLQELRVYLVGFMGSGKTTVGRQLARLMRWTFIDLDREIEIEQDREIREIFDSQGETHFRELESLELQRTGRLEKVVVATGGGAFCQQENLEWIVQHGTSVWLDLPIEQTVARLARSNTDRPLYQDEQQVRELYESRLTHYRRADFALSVGEAESARQVAQRIVRGLDLRGRGGRPCAT